MNDRECALTAIICHEANRAYCVSIGDNSQPDWDSAPEWQKMSAINGVKFHRDNPNADASASHENWMKEKTVEGWKYGPVKDPIAKEHPCYLPYDELPIEQRIKDHIFRSVVHAHISVLRAGGAVVLDTAPSPVI